MFRERLDEYLDGGLSAAERAAVEALVAADPAVARVLAGLKADRALRMAAYETYTPTRHEAAALSARVMAEAHAPVGRIGVWVRRGAAIAASLVIVAGTFAAGRMTAPPTIVENTHTVYNVVYTDITGDQNVREFASMDERDAFVKDLEKGGATGIAVADLMMPGHL